MKITVNRQSVCMDDGVEDHSMEIKISDYETFKDIFHKLIKLKYFPCVAGNDGVWTLFCGDADLVSWITKNNQFFTRFVAEPEPPAKNWGGQNIYFRYFTTQTERRKYIFDRFDGNSFHIWHEGFKTEYDSYVQ